MEISKEMQHKLDSIIEILNDIRGSDSKEESIHAGSKDINSAKKLLSIMSDTTFCVTINRVCLDNISFVDNMPGRRNTDVPVDIIDMSPNFVSRIFLNDKGIDFMIIAGNDFGFIKIFTIATFCNRGEHFCYNLHDTALLSLKSLNPSKEFPYGGFTAKKEYTDATTAVTGIVNTLKLFIESGEIND